MRFPYTITSTSISVFIGGTMRTLNATSRGFDALREHLKGAEHDADFIDSIIDKAKMVSRLTKGAVTVVGNTVYYKGAPIHSTLTEKLVALLNDGFEVTPWVNFLERIMQNPSEQSRKCLFNFLEHWSAPITEDGCFIAFKAVRSDYKDLHTGTMDNSPGKVVSMPREDVDADPNQTCSRGLHVAASIYLEGYIRSDRGHIISVKVAPEDVVAVPHDYNFAKMRTCRYEVLGDVAASDIPDVERRVVFETGAPTVVRVEWDDDESEDDSLDFEVDDENDEDDRWFDDEDANDNDYWDRAATEDEHDDPLASKPRMTFHHGNQTYSAEQLVAGVNDFGQRGYSRMTGIPRSTLQGWLTMIEKAG